MKKNFFVWFCGCLVLFSAITHVAAQSPFPGIIGQDDRKILEEPSDWTKAIGRVNVAGFRSKSLCTGTLIAPNKVLTAAHCVLNSRTNRAFPGRDIHFVAGQRLDEFVAHSTIETVSFPLGFDKDKTPRNDVAVLTLSQPMQIAPMELSVGDVIKASLSHISYGRDRPYLPVSDSECEVTQHDKTIWLTDCDTNFGGSGGPVILEKDGQKRLAAIMVGVISGKHSIAVPVSVLSGHLETVDVVESSQK